MQGGEGNGLGFNCERSDIMRVGQVGCDQMRQKAVLIRDDCEEAITSMVPEDVEKLCQASLRPFFSSSTIIFTVFVLLTALLLA